MSASTLPDAKELIERIKFAMNAAHEEWRSGVKPTDAIKSTVWKLGFELADEYGAHLYPFASSVKATRSEAGEFAKARLEARGAHFWPYGKRGEEHSVLKEFHYDVTWVEFSGEYTDFGADLRDRNTPKHFPAFRRLVLALESELSGGPASGWPRWQVLFDFNKLLGARADLRVMVWPKDRIEEGVTLLESRLQSAEGWDDGSWLLSGWGNDGFEHVAYHNGQRQN